MKKRILQLICVLIPLMAIAFFTYTTYNPIILNTSPETITINNVQVNAPRGWSAGYYDGDNGEHIESMTDEKGEMRIAVGAIHLNAEHTFSELPADYIKLVCDSIVSDQEQPLNEPTALLQDGVWRVDYQYLIDNTLMTINFALPANTSDIYEIVEIAPTQETTKIRMEILNVIMQTV